MKRLIATTALSLALCAPALSFAADTGAATSTHAFIDSSRLLKADIHTPQGQKVGDVESVLLDKNGQTQAVIVDVGGFLGMGEHRIALNWTDLQVSDNGRRVVTNYSKDQLKGLPEYKYPDQKTRNTAFYDPAWYPLAGASVNTAASDRMTPMKPTKSSDRTGTAEWRRISGEFKASRLLDAKVRSTSDQDVGNVKDVLADSSGKLRAVVVDVGGFLGMGSHPVALDFARLQMSHKGDDIRLTTAMTKDQLKSLPEFNPTIATADMDSHAMRTSGGGTSMHKISVTKK